MEICLLKLEYVVYISSVSCVVNLGVMLDSANSYLELGTESTIDKEMMTLTMITISVFRHVLHVNLKCDTFLLLTFHLCT